MNQPLSYHNTGVNYDVLDEFKRNCQRSAATTVDLLSAHGAKEPAGIRGESAYLVETEDQYLAHVEEGLGTKNLVADAMIKLAAGKGIEAENRAAKFYHSIAIDTVGTIVNDLLTVGALPLAVAMHAAVGNAKWFENVERAKQLAEGFAAGCRQAGAVWGGGETPALRGLVEEEAIILAGSAMGTIRPKHLRISGEVKHGDAMIFAASSGVHANGLTLCRQLAERLPEGYLTKLPSGRSYGEVLLDPSVIYSGLIRGCQQANLPIHYAVHLTGHGWRKLMRLEESFVYRVTNFGKVPEIFPFIAKTAGLDAQEMYGTFNMGLGFALYVAQADAEKCVAIAKAAGFDAWIGGTIEKQGDRKAVVIEGAGEGGKSLEYDGSSLAIRA